MEKRQELLPVIRLYYDDGGQQRVPILRYHGRVVAGKDLRGGV